MCGGGSGGGGSTQYNWNDTLAPQWQQLLKDSTAKAYSNAYVAPPMQRIAGFSPDQTQAMNDIRAMTSAGGEPAAVDANAQIQKTLAGNYLSGPDSNPGQWQTNTAAGQANPYMGYGPAFQQQLQGQLGDITNAYNNGTAADTARQFALSGTFGGSANQNAMTNNQLALGKTLSNATANAYQNQFNQSAGLAENQLGRQTTAQENQINRINSDYNTERGHMMGAIAPGQNTNNMFFQGVQQLMGVGDLNQQNQQAQLTQNYNDWLNAQNRDFQNADWLSGMYSRAQGGMSPNSTTQQSAYNAPLGSQILGAGLLGYGLTH
jgi:hypothetical protein